MEGSEVGEFEEELMPNLETCSIEEEGKMEEEKNERVAPVMRTIRVQIKKSSPSKASLEELGASAKRNFNMSSDWTMRRTRNGHSGLAGDAKKEGPSVKEGSGGGRPVEYWRSLL